MSLWRVKHTLSPVVEYALVGLVAAYGLLAIYFASLRPLAASVLAPSGSLPQPVALDLDSWTRYDVPSVGYAFAVPPGWSADASDPRDVRLGRSAKERAQAPEAGEGMAIASVPIAPRQELANLAAADFAGQRAAVYATDIDGHDALFAVAFENGRLRRQALYVQDTTATALVARAAWTDPAAFAALASSLRLYAPIPLMHP